MPTVVTKTYGAGGDYATWALAHAASQINLPGLDQQWDLQALLQDHTPGAFSGASVDSTHFRRWMPAPGARHNRLRNTGARWNGANVSMQEKFMRVENMEITGSAVATLVSFVETDQTVDGNLIYGGLGNFTAIGMTAGAFNYTIINNAVWGGGSVITANVAATGGRISNNTLGNFAARGIRNTHATSSCQNNIACSPVGGVVACYSGLGGTSDHNISSDATATGTGSQINKTLASQITVATAGIEDPTLVAGNVAQDLGTNLAWVTVDIVGTVRPQNVTTDIGCWEVPAPAPIVTLCTPPAGPNNALTLVALTTTNALPGATIDVDGVPATGVSVVSPTLVNCTFPFGAVGPADVKITNPGGLNSTLVGGYTYTQGPPTITNINPSSGSVAMETPVVLTTTNAVSPSVVKVDGITVPSQWISATQVNATFNAHPAGFVNVQLINPDLQSYTVINGYEYKELAAQVELTSKITEAVELSSPITEAVEFTSKITEAVEFTSAIDDT